MLTLMLELGALFVTSGLLALWFARGWLRRRPSVYSGVLAGIAAGVLWIVTANALISLGLAGGPTRLHSYGFVSMTQRVMLLLFQTGVACGLATIPALIVAFFARPTRLIIKSPNEKI